MICRGQWPTHESTANEATHELGGYWDWSSRRTCKDLTFWTWDVANPRTTSPNSLQFHFIDFFHVHFTLYTLHSTLHSPHSTLYTTLHTLHFTLHTLHTTLYTFHSTFHTPHYTSHSTLYTLPQSETYFNNFLKTIFDVHCIGYGDGSLLILFRVSSPTHSCQV